MDVSIPNSEWASPGGAVDVPRPARESGITTQALDERPSGTRPLRGSPVDRLQPRSIGQLLDSGFEVVRFRGRTIATLAALVILPLYALPAVLSANAAGTAGSPFSVMGGSNPFITGSGSLSSAYWRTIILALVGQVGLMLARMLLGVAIAHLVTSWMVGQDPTVRETLRHVRGRSLSAIVAWLVLLPVKLVSALPCYLGLIYTMPVFAILAPVVSVERAGPFRSIARTHSLAIRRYGPFLGMWALWLVASAMITGAAQAFVAILTWLFSDISWGWILTTSLTTVFTAIFATVEVAVWSMAYVDVRLRREGVDIAFEIDEEFGRAGA